MASRLPIPGSDDGTWGDILNDYLSQSLNSDGSLKSSAVFASGAATDSTVVHNSGNESIAGVKAFSSSPTVPTPTTGTAAANKTYVDNTVSAGAADATTSSKGIVQLAGDLCGTGTTAAAPVITDGAITNSKLANGAVSTNKLAAGSVTSNEIADGTITNTDISITAAIARAKLDSSTTTSLGKADTSEQTANKGAASGYASLDAGTKVPTAQLGTGTADTTHFLRGDQSWQTLPSAPVTSVAGKTGVVTLVEADVANLTSDLNATEKTASKGAASGYAPLNGSSQVPITNLPTGSTSSTVAIGNDARFAGSAAGTAGAALSATDSTTTNSRAPTGSASGDLSGTYPGPTVAKVNGVSVSGTPSNGQVITASSSSAASWSTPPSAPVASVFTRTGAVTAQSGDYTAAQVTNAADKSSGSQQNFTGELKAPDLVAGGLTGATAASRYVGATASGAPGSGTFVVGDFVIDQTGVIWICTTSGSPGTWTKVGGGVTSFNSRTGAVTPVSADYTAAQVTNAADTSSASTQTFTGKLAAPAHIASGLTGATAASRYVGATASGAPTSGTFVVGDFVIDQTAAIWVCTSAGTPGTWSPVGGTLPSPSILTTNGSTYTIPSGVTALRIIGIGNGGGGGQGGGGFSTTHAGGGGAGGGAAGVIERILTGLTPGTILTATIPAAAAGGSAAGVGGASPTAGSNGTDGANTSISGTNSFATLTALGGGGGGGGGAAASGATGTSGQPGNYGTAGHGGNNVSDSAAGVGGAGGTGDANVVGFHAGAPFGMGDSGGGGGASGGASVVGNGGTGAQGTGSFVGQGGAAGAGAAAATAATGNFGGGGGGGGGGAVNGNGSAGAAGATGSWTIVPLN